MNPVLPASLETCSGSYSHPLVTLCPSCPAFRNPSPSSIEERARGSCFLSYHRQSSRQSPNLRRVDGTCALLLRCHILVHLRPNLSHVLDQAMHKGREGHIDDFVGRAVFMPIRPYRSNIAGLVFALSNALAPAPVCVCVAHESDTSTLTRLIPMPLPIYQSSVTLHSCFHPITVTVVTVGHPMTGIIFRHA